MQVSTPDRTGRLEARLEAWLKRIAADFGLPR
jgi:hypothetical protein